ncbi:uncharacterized protein LOC143224925 isoform X2 [Tachypleus tridentatus]|uniref:uncharacterized protein LOC143224925 isoform X2 n=1 Tax=Tachypleus tridentatus TaxID=6853 RepID=UPI003FCFC4C4
MKVDQLLVSSKKGGINIQDTEGMSGLHQAALMGETAIMQLLLENGAHVDIKDNKGMRPLHYAAWQGKLEPVALLLQYNSSVNEQANHQETPLHLACQHGHVDVANKLLSHGSNVSQRNHEHRTPLDLACEFGKFKVVELLLQSGRCHSLLEESPQDTVDNDRTTCLHLAARNGHLDIISLLLQAGADINRPTLRGTALHEAAVHGRLDCVKLLIECGVDVNKPNSYDQTALDIVCSYTSCHASREMKQLLKEIVSAVEARAIKDYNDPTDSECLPLKEGDLVTVLQQCSDGRWKGIIFHKNHTSQTGYFPATAVQLLDRPVGGMNRTGTLKGSSIKKVTPPVVPDLNNRHSGSSFSSGYGSTTADRSSCCSVSTDDSFPSVPRSPNKESADCGRFPVFLTPVSVPSPTRHGGPLRFGDSQTHYTQVVVHPRPSSHPSTPTEGVHPIGFGNAPLMIQNKPLHGTQSSLEDQGIDVSPGRESPGASSGGSSSGGGSRNSTSSLDSGRASTSGSDGKANTNNRMPAQIYVSCSSQSYQSPSLGSVDDSRALSVPKINVTEMMLHSIPDVDILQTWLTSLHFEDYVHLFLQAGYDMPTISRMTPEDLTAIGIKKPTHRRRLKAEIDRLHISDCLPEYKPDTLLQWLQLLRLEEYYETLCHQGYNSVDRVTELTWEDLEEIGIQKLGHQKKIMLAIKRIKDLNSGIRRPSHVRDVQQHGLDIGGVVGVIPHPSSLALAIQPVPSYHYPSQEVAITTSRTHTSPTTEITCIPELKTFQQSPPKTDGFFLPGQRCEFSSPNQLGPHHQQNVTIQVRSPNRGHSLESLDMDDSVSTIAYPHYIQSDTWYDTVSAWRHNGYDTDSELSVQASECYNMYVSEGTPTLHRPKGMVKPRPVAKIIAKTRREETEGSEITHCIDRNCKTALKSNDHDKDGWSSLEGSPRHIIPGRTSQLYGTLKSKRTPPPPPKRTNSMRCDTQDDEDLDSIQDKAFATCVQSLRSRFDQATNKQKELLLPPPLHEEQPPSPTPSEDFPPPPSPLPSALEDSRTASVTDGLCKASGIHLLPSAKDSDELSANPVFRQRRKDSSDSNSSASSTDSNSLPFANDNAGTIKQRVNKQDQSTPVGSAKSTPVKRANHTTSSDLATSRNTQNSTAHRSNMDDRSGDVIDDIENMLVNLSNQLDAMLETESNG